MFCGGLKAGSQSEDLFLSINTDLYIDVSLESKWLNENVIQKIYVS